MKNEIAELIRELRAGSITLDEVAQRFRQRSWPSRPSPEPANYMELAAAALQDPEPDVHDSFDDVVAAYDRGEITEEQFDVLAEAVADAKRAQHRHDG